jgi:Ca-activated chloride channel family protein
VPWSFNGSFTQRGKVVLRDSRDLVWMEKKRGEIQTENPFYFTEYNPTAVFSADVDGASFSLLERYLDSGAVPEKSKIRLEEVINYFTADPISKEQNLAPENTPFEVKLEKAVCPWNKNNELVRILIGTEKPDLKDLPPNNLVFLLDVSGSMMSADRLPLLQKSMVMLTKVLEPRDHISIVIYNGNASVHLPSTSVAERGKIIDAINDLRAGGSTNGEAGLRLAYEEAYKNFDPKANNRILVGTDGDFNVGDTGDSSMALKIQQMASEGVFLSMLGFGMGNLKDEKLELISNMGNGNFYYIHNIEEARKVLETETSATLRVVAKDFKFKAHFNPDYVERYRLLGYENRMLALPDFENDAKDAGDIGAGHSVNALFEIERTRKRVEQKEIELLTLDLRYKEPEGSKSRLVQIRTLLPSESDKLPMGEFAFISGLAALTQKIQSSPYMPGVYRFGDKREVQMNFEDIRNLLKQGVGASDLHKPRKKVLKMLEQFQKIRYGK